MKLNILILKKEETSEFSHSEPARAGLAPAAHQQFSDMAGARESAHPALCCHILKTADTISTETQIQVVVRGACSLSARCYW